MTLPLPCKVNAWEPPTVLDKVIFDPFATTSPVKVIAPVRVIGLAVVVKLLAKFIAPA